MARIGSVAGLLGGAALVDAFGYVPAVCLLAAVSIVSVALVLRDRSLVTLTPRTHSDAPATPLDRRGIVELCLGFSLGIVGPGFVTSTLGVVLQPHTANGPIFPGITAATITGALLAIMPGIALPRKPRISLSNETRSGVAMLSPRRSASTDS